MTLKIHAKVILHQAGEWTDEGRKEIADWLRYQANNLEQAGMNYSKRFNARFYSVEESAGS